MNAYETLFEKRLSRRLKELQDQKRETLEGGYPTDFSAYRELVGYFRALKEFSAIMIEIAQDMNKEEKDI